MNALHFGKDDGLQRGVGIMSAANVTLLVWVAIVAGGIAGYAGWAG
jgi:hypothetical protein